MIPKVINYVWIGNKELPEREKVCIESWKEVLPDYQFNFFGNDYLKSLSLTPLMEKFYKKGKWAFLSDYVRLKALQDNPGIYLDTDIFMIKPFTDEMHKLSFFSGMGEENIINQGVIGFDGTQSIVYSLIEHYEGLTEKFEQSPMEYTPTICKFLNYNGPVGIQSSTLDFPLDNTKLYSRDYFYPIHWSGNSYRRKTYLHTKFTDNTVCMHMWTASAQNPANYNWVSSQVSDIHNEVKLYLKDKISDQLFKKLDIVMKRG